MRTHRDGITVFVHWASSQWQGGTFVGTGAVRYEMGWNRLWWRLLLKCRHGRVRIHAGVVVSCPLCGKYGNRLIVGRTMGHYYNANG